MCIHAFSHLKPYAFCLFAGAALFTTACEKDSYNPSPEPAREIYADPTVTYFHHALSEMTGMAVDELSPAEAEVAYEKLVVNFTTEEMERIYRDYRDKRGHEEVSSSQPNRQAHERPEIRYRDLRSGEEVSDAHYDPTVIPDPKVRRERK